MTRSAVSASDLSEDKAQLDTGHFSCKERAKVIIRKCLLFVRGNILLIIINWSIWVGKLDFTFWRKILNPDSPNYLPSEKLLYQAWGIPTRQLHSTIEFSSTEHHFPGSEWVRVSIHIIWKLKFSPQYFQVWNLLVAGTSVVLKCLATLKLSLLKVCKMHIFAYIKNKASLSLKYCK